MRNILKLFTLIIIVLLTGCTVYSKNIVGDEQCKLDPKKINGYWTLAKESNDTKKAFLLKVIDSDKGIVQITILEDKDKVGPIKVKITKGKLWTYFNVIHFSKIKDDDLYIWGRVKIEDNAFIYWFPSDDAFIKAIKENVIMGKENNNTDNSGKSSLWHHVVLTDSSKNIVDLIEDSERNYFHWDEPMYFIKKRGK